MGPVAILSVLVKADGVNAARAEMAGLQGQMVKADRAGGRMAQSIRRGSASSNAASAAWKRQSQTLAEVGRVGRRAAGGIAVASGAVVAHAIKTAADFEQQQSRLGATTNASRREMALFRGQAIKAGAATKFSALEAAQAQTELAKGGLSVREIMGGGLKSALALAAAGELDLADAASTTVNAMKMFKLGGGQSMHVADALAMAANRTTADVGDFAMALKMGGSVAKIAGLSFNETVLALEALAEVGIKNSDAGTSLKSFFLNITRSTPKVQEAMKGLGLSFFDAKGEIKSLPAISENLRQSFGDLTKEQFLQQAGTIAGSDAVRTLYALYDAGPKKLQKMGAELGKSGTAADVARRKQDNLKGTLENLGGSVETLQISLGTALLPVLRHSARELQGWVNEVAHIADRKDLDIGQKLQLSIAAFDRRFGGDIKRMQLGDRLGQAVSWAIPKIAEAAAKAAPHAVAAFFTAWHGADGWGKLLIAGFLLHKMGGLAAFRALGARTGGAYASGFAPAAAAAGASTAARAGRGKLTATAASTATSTAAILPAASTGDAAKARAGTRVGGFIRGLAPVAKRAGLIGLGFAAMDGLSQAFSDKSRALTAGGRIQQFFHGATVGLVPDATKTANQARDAMLRGSPDWNKKLGKALFFGDTSAGTKRALVGLQALRVRAERVFGKGVHLKPFVESQQANRALKTLDRNFAAMKNHSVGSIRDLRFRVEQNSRGIARTLQTNSAAGKNAMRRNFSVAAASVREMMHSGIVTASEGSREIRRLMVQYLGSFGISPKDAKVSIKARGVQGAKQHAGNIDKGRTEMGAGRAQGGPVGKVRRLAHGGAVQFGRAGEAGRDSIPVDFGGNRIVVAPGEQGVVFNRHQIPDVQARFADVGGLGGFFQKNKRPNHMAGGGMVGNQTSAGQVSWRQGFAGGGMVPALTALIKRIDSKGFNHGSTTGGTHAARSYHYRGQAVDYGDASNDMKRLWSVVYPARKQLPELFGPHRVTGPQNAYFFGRAGQIGGHEDHIHIAVQSAIGALGRAIAGGGGGGAVDVPKIPRMVVSGPDGGVKAMTQRMLDVTRAGAQRKVTAAAEAAGASGGGGDLSGFKGGGNALANMKLGHRMMKAFGFGEDQWPALKTLWIGESGWNNKASNPSSGAGGIPQALPASKMGAKAAAGDPAAQIGWGLKYIKGRYGSPSAALSAWQGRSPHWYDTGGLVGMAGGGFPSAKEITGQTKKVKGLKGKVDKAKKPAGEKKATSEFKKASRVLSKLKKARKRGQKARTKKQQHLTDQVKDFALPQSMLAGVTGMESSIQDQQDLMDQAGNRYRVDDVLSQQELDDLVGRQATIRNLIGGATAGKGGLWAALSASVLPTLAKKKTVAGTLIEKLKARIAKNLKLIAKKRRRKEKLEGQIKKARAAIESIGKKKKPTDADKKKKAALSKDVETWSGEVSRITQRELPALYADNAFVTGEKMPKVLTGDTGQGSLLGDARQALTDLTDEHGTQAEKLRPGGLPGQWETANLNITTLIREGATKPDVADTSSITSERLDLETELRQQAQMRYAVSESLLKSLSQGNRYGVKFMGAFEKGGVALVGESGPELAHMPSGTRVHTAADTRSMLGTGDVQVIVNGNIVQEPGDTRDPVEVVLGDRRFPAAVEQAARGLARRGGRPLPGGAKR